jgi:chemotaxis protein CheD
MRKPPHVIEIFLQPGEWWFGDEHTRIRTILGSCVAVTLWHAQRRIGGMCHFMLPSRARPQGSGPDGRYGDEAIEALSGEIRHNRAHPREFEAKLFGGGRMFHYAGRTGKPSPRQVHDRNVSAAHELMSRCGFTVKAEHLGGHGHRQVIFDIWSGHAWVKHTPLVESAAARNAPSRSDGDDAKPSTGIRK